MSSSAGSLIRRRLDPAALDYLLAALLLVGFQVQIWTVAHGHSRWWQAGTAVAITFAVAIRRYWTLQALLLACAAFTAQLVFFDHQTGQGGLYPVSLLLLFYGAGAFLDGPPGTTRTWDFGRPRNSHLSQQVLERAGRIVRGCCIRRACHGSLVARGG